MKKRKTYEISVIDKTYSREIYDETYSRTHSDETKFYTSDTALELVFKLKETEYNFESAEIVLLNIDDRSLVTRPVSKSSDSFTYELEDDITAHYGEWRGQVRFEKAGEIYVSSPVKFRIENDLSNERPPQLSDVQSWVSLRRYADSLVDELKQVVLEVEGMDGTFNANELERQDKFETAEQSRQATFEANESERDETFSTNEIIRQTKELEREKAEGTRQTVFDDNESIRTETFNANEVARQANEEARELAEDERENSEAQRKIDHKNRNAEMDGKANKKQEDWITPTLLNGFKGDVRYRKTQFGHLEINGTITSDNPLNLANVLVFSLPSDYRPARGMKFEVTENSFNTSRNAKLVFSLYERGIKLYGGNGGSSWDINVSMPMN